ncbi:hypothetical protein CALCODRAFT_513551 [Calocera cornea HHB12733]|uniref:Uncharacterized protein n=1 Tax=Calocera cornea HHB12733 TaxID=1353952 RepID=A0A165BZN7_9BASI|nr:hypothetical protein CALCODRAFT_513551 [Calocera cornea HHB12733]
MQRTDTPTPNVSNSAWTKDEDDTWQLIPARGESTKPAHPMQEIERPRTHISIPRLYISDEPLTKRFLQQYPTSREQLAVLEEISQEVLAEEGAYEEGCVEEGVEPEPVEHAYIRHLDRLQAAAQMLYISGECEIDHGALGADVSPLDEDLMKSVLKEFPTSGEQMVVIEKVARDVIVEEREYEERCRQRKVEPETALKTYIRHVPRFQAEVQMLFGTSQASALRRRIGDEEAQEMGHRQRITPAAINNWPSGRRSSAFLFRQAD